MVSVIMVGAASALLIALHGIDGSASNAVRARQANEALDQITSDLQVAVGVVERTTTSMAVTVADRNGDGQPETIRYAWSGVSGDPLTRSVNGGAAESIADNVTYFNIDSLLATYGPIESQEMVLTFVRLVRRRHAERLERDLRSPVCVLLQAGPAGQLRLVESHPRQVLRQAERCDHRDAGGRHADGRRRQGADRHRPGKPSGGGDGTWASPMDGTRFNS